MKQMFLTSSSEVVMDDIVKKLPKSPAGLKLALINTAAEAEEGDHWWLRAEKKKLTEVGFEIDEFSITGMKSEEIEKKLKDKQVIYVCGGNTFYLLDQMIKTGFDKIVKRKVEEGVVYMGSSAGSMVVGVRIDLVSTIDDRSKAPDLKSDGLDIIDMAILPHWGTKDFLEEYKSGFETMYTKNLKIVPLSDGQYIWVKGNSIELVQV